PHIHQQRHAGMVRGALHGNPSRRGNVNPVIAVPCNGNRPDLRCLGKGQGVCPLPPCKPGRGPCDDHSECHRRIPDAWEYHRHSNGNVHGSLCICIPPHFRCCGVLQETGSPGSESEPCCRVARLVHLGFLC